MFFAYIKKVHKRYYKCNKVVLVTFEISNDCKNILFDCGDYYRYSNKISMHKDSDKCNYYIMSKNFAKRFFDLRCACKLVINYNSYVNGNIGVKVFLTYINCIIEDSEFKYNKFINNEI